MVAAAATVFSPYQRATWPDAGSSSGYKDVHGRTRSRRPAGDARPSRRGRTKAGVDPRYGLTGSLRVSAANPLRVLLSQSRSRTPRRADRARRTAGCAPLGILGGVRGVSRVSAGQHGGRQRRGDAGSRRLPDTAEQSTPGPADPSALLHHAVQRRRDGHRGGQSQAGLHGGVGAGRRRHRRRRHRSIPRAAQRHFTGHGRDDCQGRSDPGRATQGHHRLRSGCRDAAHRRGGQGRRLPGAHTGHRPGGGRGRRRQPRLD